MTERVSSSMDAVPGLVSELVKAYKATSIYPIGHPSRARFLGRLNGDLLAYLETEGRLKIDVSARGLKVGGEDVVTKDNAHAFLATECFGRQISSVVCLKGFQQKDIDALFAFLSESPERIRAEGGATEFIRQRSTGALQVEQVDYEGILERREEVSVDGASTYTPESHSPVAAPNPGLESSRISSPTVFDDVGSHEVSQEQWLEGKLQDLGGTVDPAEYKRTMRDILLNLKATGNLGLSKFSLMVVRHLGRDLLREVPDDIRITARAAAKELAGDDLLDSLVGDITSRDGDHREPVQAVLETCGERSIAVLLHRLAEEEEAFGRKALITSLLEFGTAIRPYLDRWLADDRWYVVRNSLGLLSQAGDAEDAQRVIGFLSHPNPKVRLEALRFLSRFPASVPDEVMRKLIKDPDEEVSARAILAIGAIQGPEGVRHLMMLAKKPLFGQGDIVRRELAIKGLGRARGSEPVEFLRRILSGRPFLNPEGYERVQQAAVEALAEIGGPRAAAILMYHAGRLKGAASKTAEEFLRKVKTAEISDDR